MQVDAVDPDMVINVEAAALKFKKNIQSVFICNNTFKSNELFWLEIFSKKAQIFWALTLMFNFIF